MGLGQDEKEIPRKEVIIEKNVRDIPEDVKNDGANLIEDNNNSKKQNSSSVDFNVPELNFDEQKKAVEEIKEMAHGLKKQAVEGDLSDPNLQLKIKLKLNSITDSDLNKWIRHYLDDLLQLNVQRKVNETMPEKNEIGDINTVLEIKDEKERWGRMKDYLLGLKDDGMCDIGDKKGINWDYVNKWLKDTNDPNILEEFYNLMSSYSNFPNSYLYTLNANYYLEKKGDDFEGQNVKNIEKFEQIFIEKLLDNPETYNFLEGKLIEEASAGHAEHRSSFPIMFNQEGSRDEEDKDTTDDIKAFVIKKMFKKDPDRARLFFGNHLKLLPQLRKEEWSNSGTWASDPDEGLTTRQEEEIFELEKEGVNQKYIDKLKNPDYHKYSNKEKIDQAKSILEDDLDEYKQSLFYNKNLLRVPKDNPYIETENVEFVIKKANEKIDEIELLLRQLEEKKDISCCMEYLNERSLKKTGTKSFLDQDNESREEDYDYMPNFDNEEDEHPYENELSWKAVDHRYFEVFPKVTSTILEGFKEYGKKGDVDSLIKYIEKDFFSYTHIKELSEAFQKIDINYSAAKLLEMLKNENTGDLRKKITTNILHRLEFGQIGISEGGVNYLEKMYDLGENNNPDYHVSRLTADGEIGVFNEEKELIKYFHLGNLSSDEKKVKAKVLDFAYDTLFVGKEGETDEEKKKRLEYLAEFKKNYYKIAQDKIFKKTDVQLNNLSFKEQGWFLIHINELEKKGGGEKEKERLKGFVKEYGEEGIKTFLSMNANEKSGESILNIAEKLKGSEGLAKNIFSKFNEVSSLVKETNEDLSQQFFKGDKIVEPAAEILKRAHRILINFEQKITGSDFENLDTKDRVKIKNELNNELRDIQKDVVFFASMFKTAYKGKENVDFNEVKNLDFSIQTSGMLNEGDREKIREITNNNYSNNEDQQQVVLDGVEKSFANREDTQWYILRKESTENESGEITSFVRFDEDENGDLYVASLNVDPKFKGSALGEAMYNNAVNSEAKFHKITGRAEMGKQMSMYHIEKAGFVADGIIVDDKTKIPYFRIIRDDKVNNQYKSRREGSSLENIVGAKGDYRKSLNEEEIFSDIYELGSSEMQSAIEECSRNNYVVTRILPTDNENQIKCIFEKKPYVQEVKGEETGKLAA